MPEFYEKNKLPEDMPDDLKTHILKTNPKEVSEKINIMLKHYIQEECFHTKYINK